MYDSRTDSRYEDAMILKSYVFDFSNSYSQLIYYAFVKPNLVNHYLFGISTFFDQCDITTSDGAAATCQGSVMINLFIIFIGGQGNRTSLLNQFSSLK
jgi:hypothetical protein